MNSGNSTTRRSLMKGASLLAASTAAPILAGASPAGAASGELKAFTGAVVAPTRFVESNGRKLAYRSVGEGKPIALCTRFRGVLDLWDPAFIDGLAAEGFKVVTFDYSGLGQSTGEKTYKPGSLANDAKDLIDALGLKDVVIGGWSIGGTAAQIFLAMFGASVSHAVLIATTPPGKLVKSSEQLFLDAAREPGASLEQFTTVFFEPKDEGSRAASKRSFDRIFARKSDLSPEVPADWAAQQLSTTPKNPIFPSEEVLQFLKTTTLPILHIGGDHDIALPVDNWYALNGQLPTVQLITYPRAGHGPHFQHPETAAKQIAAFVNTTKNA
jgi:pimeloyl-ACP methyl ester carboxylesterase